MADGQCGCEAGVIDQSLQFAVKPQYDEGIEDYLRPLFQQYYTMSFENYPVDPGRVHGLEVQPCKVCGR